VFKQNTTKQAKLFTKANLFGSNSGASTTFTSPIDHVSQQKCINDFDSSLILENIDKTTKNKAVRLNLKINTLEKNLTKVNEELELMKILNLDKDKSKREQLSKFKAYLELQITSLKAEKKRFGVFYSISGFIDENIDLKYFFKVKNYIMPYFKKYYNLVLNYVLNKKSNVGKFGTSVASSKFKW